jgi:hypothetical protein
LKAKAKEEERVKAVINPNYSDKGEKKFETGKTTSGLIDSILSYHRVRIY